MKIALDAMGSDSAPAAEVAGAVKAARSRVANLEIILVGPKELLEKELQKHRRLPPNLTIHHAPQVITMDDKPVEGLRQKRDSSIAKVMKLVKSGEARAAVSAGNTGAVVAAAKLMLGTLPGIFRPAIATIIPAAGRWRKRDQAQTGDGGSPGATLSPSGKFFKPLPISILIDSGANIDCKPRQLLQFAIMGSEYARFITKIESPRVGLLSVGTESTKGNELTRETHKLLECSRLNFRGNLEGQDVFMGDTDVIVSDGFVGNVVLKVGEGLAIAIKNMLIGEIKRHFLRTIGGMLMKPAFIRLWKRADSSEYGGAPLLGIDGICIICHGSSSPKAIANAVQVAQRYEINEVNQKIMDAIAASRSGREEK